MKNPLLLALFILGMCLFVIFYVVSAAFYLRRHKTKYHFYKMFPYEFNYPNVFRQNVYGNVLLVLACLSVIAFYNINPLQSIYSTIGIVISIVTTILIIVLLLFPIRYLKAHMVVSCILMTLGAAAPLFNFFAAYSQLKIVETELGKALCFVSMSISAVLAVSMLMLIINPKLTFKIYMDKTTDEQGNEVLERPKFIFMALSEWWAIFLFFLSPLAILLLVIL